jgi:hypothetical protein
MANVCVDQDAGATPADRSASAWRASILALLEADGRTQSIPVTLAFRASVTSTNVTSLSASHY